MFFYRETTTIRYLTSVPSCRKSILMQWQRVKRREKTVEMRRKQVGRDVGGRSFSSLQMIVPNSTQGQ
jgi:hypothetical protein